MIEKIIEEELIDIYFQPIVSVRTKTIYAFEALTRCTFNGQYIPPDVLFNLAKDKGLNLQLDEMTRIKAIKKFHKFYKENKDLILFLNFESDNINNFDHTDYCSRFIETIVNLKIPFKNFVLEIKEDEITNSDVIRGFCSSYKNLGFSIALDDFGTGNSNFHRIDLIRPNIIKIDKSLFVDMENNLVNKEVVKAIAKMSNNLGIRVLAEGVEERDSICIGLKENVNLFQGYYFFKAKSDINKKDMDEIIAKCIKIGKHFKSRIINGINRKRELIDKYNLISKNIIKKLKSIESSYEVLQKEFDKLDEVEAIYLIDCKSSKQINDTIMNNKLDEKFKASKDKDEHYLKEYYYITLESKQGSFLSHKYISYASGNICKTFAKKFDINESKSCILCLDIRIKEK